ncbi:hypothetical protein AB0D14_23385 [Streptomyces sp. NPDC048484]|uniref:hypothetical protein n=1 Tax=Streptomyces sp. NPDC048484 TaxID=3155146 RepID=UPI00344707A3
MLLYAQPLTRVVRLTVDDVVHNGEAVLLRLGEPASPIPEPAPSLLLDYIADRDHMNTATNQASPWLFPGRRAGQPFRPDHLSALLNETGGTWSRYAAGDHTRSPAGWVPRGIGDS